MAKAVFQRNQRVWVESVGAWALIEKIEPVWAKGFEEPGYLGRRRQALIIAVECGRSVSTCFCASSQSGPEVRAGFVEFAVPEPTTVLYELTRWALDRGEELAGLSVVRPTLEDVYLSLTGGEGA